MWRRQASFSMAANHATMPFCFPTRVGNSTAGLFANASMQATLPHDISHAVSNHDVDHLHLQKRQSVARVRFRHVSEILRSLNRLTDWGSLPSLPSHFPTHVGRESCKCKESNSNVPLAGSRRMIVFCSQSPFTKWQYVPIEWCQSIVLFDSDTCRNNVICQY